LGNLCRGEIPDEWLSPVGAGGLQTAVQPHASLLPRWMA
jgi:hypothetical protein